MLLPLSGRLPEKPPESHLPPGYAYHGFHPIPLVYGQSRFDPVHCVRSEPLQFLHSRGVLPALPLFHHISFPDPEVLRLQIFL